MVVNGIEGSESCAEIFQPHYSGLHLSAITRLENALTSSDEINVLGDALAGYYRMSDYAGPYLEFDTAPNEVKSLDLCIRDAARALIRKAGGNPDDFNTPPMQSVSASEHY